MSKELIFKPVDGRDGVLWMAKFGGMAGAVAAGHLAGQLSNTTLGLIGGFTIVRAVIPYFRSMSSLRSDIASCREEREALIEIDVDDIDAVLQIDDVDAGSVFKLAKLILSSPDRSTRQGAEATFFESFDAHWDERISPLHDASEQTPVMGLAGSLLGIIAALALLGNGVEGNAGLFAALSTMALTTLVGGGAFIVISGLARDAANKVAKHRSDLKFVAKMLHRALGDVDRTDNERNPFEL